MHEGDNREMGKSGDRNEMSTINRHGGILLSFPGGKKTRKRVSLLFDGLFGGEM